MRFNPPSAKVIRIALVYLSHRVGSFPDHPLPDVSGTIDNVGSTHLTGNKEVNNVNIDEDHFGQIQRYLGPDIGDLHLQFIEVLRLNAADQSNGLPSATRGLLKPGCHRLPCPNARIR
jgi:hypothetical protein